MSREVRSFSRSMIKQGLEELDLHYLVDRDDDFVLDLGDLRFFLMASGSRNDVYTIYCVLPRRFRTGDDAVQAITLCNKWNRERRWPKAYARINEDGEARITLEQSLDLEMGIHQALLNDFTKLALATSIGFWEWLEEEA